MLNNHVTVLDAGQSSIAAIAPFSPDFDRLIRLVPQSHWNAVAMRWEFPVGQSPMFRLVFAGWLISSAAPWRDDTDHGEEDETSVLPPTIAEAMRTTFSVVKYSLKTRKRYTAIIERYARFIDCPLFDSTAADAIRFISSLERDCRASASTLNQAVSALRFLYVRILGREAPIERRPRPDHRLPSILSREEAHAIISAPRNIKHKLILALAYSAGLRVSEIASLRVSDIDADRNLIFVRSGKGRKDRYTLLAMKTKRILNIYTEVYQPSEWLFEGQHGGHLSIRSIQGIFTHASKNAGISKNVSIHSLRHSFATHLLEDGTDIRYIQELLGHANAKTTQIYTHVAQKDFLRIHSPFDLLSK